MSRPPSPPGGTAPCPDADALAGLALGEADGADRLALADHVASCAACAADFRLLRGLHAEASPRTTARGSRRAWIAAAAAALAAVALSPLLLREPAESVRGRAPEVRPPDGAMLEAAPESLAWPDQPGARAYRVKLFRGDASLVWDSDDIGRPPASLPADVRGGMRPGGSWYWTVEALGPVQQRRMGPFWFQLR
jgi:hypothetical protein